MKQKGITIILAAAAAILGCIAVIYYFSSDRTAPKISFSGEISYAEGQDWSVLLQGVTAMDDTDGDLTGKIQVESVIPLAGESRAVSYTHLDVYKRQLFALVLIAGLVIYLIVDNAKFKQSKSEIMETAERYLQEQPLAEKEGSGGSDALEELLNQYWAEIKLPGGINGQGKGAVLDKLKVLKEQEATAGRIVEAQSLTQRAPSKLNNATHLYTILT